MFRSITEPFKALELTFPNGTVEFWKNDVEDYGQYYERVGYELKASGSFNASEVCKVRALGADDQYYDLTDPDMHRVIWEIRDVTVAADKFKATITVDLMTGEEDNKKPVRVETFFVSDSPAAVMRLAADFIEGRPGLPVNKVVIVPVCPVDSPVVKSMTVAELPLHIPV